MERLSHNHAEDTSELLSTYVDNALDVTERRRAEAQVQSCPACAQELRDLRMFKALLQDVPNVQPRRSFTLDPATAVGPRRLLFPTLRLATLVASVLFFVVLGVDVLNIGGASPQTTGTFSTRQAPAAAQRQFEFNDSAGGAAESAQGDTAAASKAADAEASSAPAAALAPMPSAEASAVAEASAAMSAATEPLTETAVAAANTAPSAGEDQLPPSVASAPAADQAQSAAPAQDLAGGAQPSLQANEPISPDTIGLQPVADDNSSGPQTTLRIIEIGLGLIALALASGALWTWRRQR